jgi:hypothetical protein
MTINTCKSFWRTFPWPWLGYSDPSNAHHHQAAGSYSKSKKPVGGGSGAW